MENLMSRMKKYEKLHKSMDGNARLSRTRVLSGADFNIFTQGEIREVDEYGKLCKPILPITGTVYCIDFSETFYKRILKHLVAIAFSLRAKYKYRTFVDNSDCIYIATTDSREEFNAAVAWGINTLALTLYGHDLAQNKVDLLTEVICIVFSATMLGLV